MVGAPEEVSKIGNQHQNGTIPDLPKLLDKHPIATKLLGNALNLGVAQTCRDRNPDGLIILRADASNWDIDNPQFIKDFAANAMRLAEPFRNAGLCDFLESPNEPVVQDVTRAQKLNDQQVWLAQEYKKNGFQPTAYSFSVGNPDYPLWPYLNDGILACDGWLNLHEYGVMPLSYDAENLSLRHRMAKSLMSPAVQRILKVIISECFMDFGIGRPPDGYPTRGGYRMMPAQGDDDLYWIRTLTQQLDWWDGELAQDDYVICATGFGYALNPPWDEENLKFDVAGVDTDRTYYINWQKSGKAVIPVPPIGGPMQVYQPYQFPKRLSDVGWQGIEGQPVQGQAFYRIQPSAGLLVGVSAFVRVTVVDTLGTPLAGVKVVNDFGDGHGEIQQTDSTGTVQFNFGPSSAFTPPATPPLTFFVADDGAFKDEDKFIHYTYRLSDVVRGGDSNGQHTEGSYVLVKQIVLPDATTREDAIRLRAYPAKSLTIPLYCKDCALQAWARTMQWGAVLTDEFYVAFLGKTYVCQGFALGILATEVGHYNPSDFFQVMW